MKIEITRMGKMFRSGKNKYQNFNLNGIEVQVEKIPIPDYVLSPNFRGTFSPTRLIIELEDFKKLGSPHEFEIDEILEFYHLSEGAEL